jgi:hypothetical protein
MSGIRTVKILEVGQLDTLAHGEHVCSCAQAIRAHPQVSSVQGRDGLGAFGGRVQSMLDISPGSNDGTQHHEAEGEERHAGDGAAEPEDLAIGDQDDGQVLEDGVDGDGEEAEGPGGGVDHADE